MAAVTGALVCPERLWSDRCHTHRSLFRERRSRAPIVWLSCCLLAAAVLLASTTPVATQGRGQQALPPEVDFSPKDPTPVPSSSVIRLG